MKAIENTATKRWSNEWPLLTETHYETAYQKGYKAGWKAAYEKAFNSGLETGLRLKSSKLEPISQQIDELKSKGRDITSGHITKFEPAKFPQGQKELAQILFNCRIKSQKKLIKIHEVPEEFDGDIEKKKELRLMNEMKLKKLCHKLHISAEGNKTVMIDRIINKMYHA